MNITFSVEEQVLAIMSSGLWKFLGVTFDEHMHAFITVN